MRKITVLLICVLVLSGCSKARWRSAHMDEPVAAKRSHTLVHRVAEGETLKEIALNYFDDIDQARVIKSDNKLGAEPVSGSELTLKFTNRQWQIISVRMEAIDAYNSGVAAMKQGRSTDALALFRSALDIDSEFQNARYNLGLVELQLGNLDSALELLNVVQKEWPNDMQVMQARGNVLFSSDRYSEAATVFNTITKADSKNSAALFSLARCLTELGEKKEAIKTWKKFLKVDNSSSWSKLARRYLQELEDE
ncbi:MAG: tetratricopeptide repeat protein [bacterium]|nr:tetratricopeptide repeat protein [bacterium]MCP4800960.1 tetratricopeptide repeat protein [bacterium]